MKKILLLLSNGFEILEASAFIDVMGWNFEEGDKSTKLFTCGLKKHLKSSFGQQFTVDYLVKEIDVNNFDALAIPGGFKNYCYYEDAYNEEFLNLIHDFGSKNKIIASICVGALPVAKSGILTNKSGTTYNSEDYRKELAKYGVNLLDNPVVIDNNFITSNSPSTALDVAFVLLELLTNKENTMKVRNLMGFNLA